MPEFGLGSGLCHAWPLDNFFTSLGLGNMNTLACRMSDSSAMLGPYPWVSVM